MQLTKPRFITLHSLNIIKTTLTTRQRFSGNQTDRAFPLLNPLLKSASKAIFRPMSRKGV
jgi:hypothetical protein